MSHIRVGTYVAWVQSQGSKEAAFSLQSLTLVGEERREGKVNGYKTMRGGGADEREKEEHVRMKRGRREIYINIICIT